MYQEKGEGNIPSRIPVGIPLRKILLGALITLAVGVFIASIWGNISTGLERTKAEVYQEAYQKGFIEGKTLITSSIYEQLATFQGYRFDYAEEENGTTVDKTIILVPLR